MQQSLSSAIAAFASTTSTFVMARGLPTWCHFRLPSALGDSTAASILAEAAHVPPPMPEVSSVGIPEVAIQLVALLGANECDNSMSYDNILWCVGIVADFEIYRC